MFIVHIEHAVHDYAAWKAAFDADPVGRRSGGVRGYRIARALDDSRAVTIDLEFDDHATASAFREALERLWETPQAQAALSGAPTGQVVELTEAVSY
ncbi:MAG: hypothetical protein LH650_05470 [Chloroflexi bacterium]|nr:hypothetical protein [Chloroflexota bacterium]